MTDTVVGSPLVVERRVALEAVRTASLLCRSVRSSLGAADRTHKADLSPVTVADLGSQALISLALSEWLPDDPLLGEEDSSPLSDSPELAIVVLERVRAYHPTLDLAGLRATLDRCDDAGGPGRRWWTLDPVDGTKGFLRDEQYAVALALVEDGEVVLGVLGCPNLPFARGVTALGEPDARVVGERAAATERGCIFIAERGAGAWQVPLPVAAQAEGAGDAAARRRINVAEVHDAAEGCYAESVEAGHSDQADAARIAAWLGIERPPVRLDSQAKYAVVARGDASIYLRLPHGAYRENVWDHAAGYLIVREAGGEVSDAAGQPLDLTTGRRMERNRGVVATAGAIHAQVIAAVRRTLGE